MTGGSYPIKTSKPGLFLPAAQPAGPHLALCLKGLDSNRAPELKEVSYLRGRGPSYSSVALHLTQQLRHSGNVG